MKTKGAHWAQFHQRSTYSFYARRSQTRKKRQSSQQCHLVLLGPTSVKAAQKMLVKSTPGLFMTPFLIIYDPWILLVSRPKHWSLHFR